MTAAVIVATTTPLNGKNNDSGGPVVDPLPTLNDLSATGSFTIPTDENALLALMPAGAKSGATYTVSPNDGRLKVSNGAYVRGPTAWTAAGTTIFTITETFSNTLGQSVSKNSTVTITANAPVVVVPGLATVVDAVGRNTRSGVKIGQLPAGASLSGTNSTHFTVDALGQVTVSAAGQTAGLAASYSMTVTGGGSINTMAFSALANTFTVTNATELEAAFNVAKLTTNVDWKLAIPTGTTINSPAVLVAPQNIITRRYIELKNAMMAGTIVDDNKNLTPQDIQPLGFTAMSGGNAGTSLWAGLNGKQAYNPDAVASVSGGSITIYCPTVMGAKMNALVYAVDCKPLRFENIDFCLMSSVDMYDSKATAPTYITREAVISVASVSPTGGVLTVTFDDVGADYPPNYIVGIQKASGLGGSFAASAVAKADGTIDPASFVIKNAGSGHTTATKLRVFESRVWDPKQLPDAPQFPAYNPANGSGGLFYQFKGQSTTVKQDDGVAEDYSSFVFRKCRFGIGGRSDIPAIPPLRYNRCINISNHNHMVIEDCLFDGFWIAVGHTKWVRTDARRNAFFNYTNDIFDTYPTTPNIDPAKTGPNNRYDLLPAPFRNTGYIFDTDNYCGRADQTTLLLSNSHSDYRQHSGTNDLQTQNVLFANNWLNMHCSSLYITTQGYLDNGDGTAPKKQKVRFNFAAASTTNSIMTSYTDTSDPNASVFENNFSTRTIYGTPDLGGGVDTIGGGINIIKYVQGTVIRRNVIKEVWDMGPANGGRIAFNPPGDTIMKGQLTTNPDINSTQPRTYRPDPTNQPNYRVPVGPVYIYDNFFISYLTPDTGAGTSYPEVFKGVNAVGDGPAFIWNGTTGTGGFVAIGFHRWWEKVRDVPTTRSWADWWAAVARGKADIQSIFTPQAGSGADGRHCFPAASF